MTRIDYSVFPDREMPIAIETDGEKADYVARICAAWDFGLIPTRETIALFAQWREIFDRYPIVTSPAFMAFRSWFGWPRIRGHVLQANWELLQDPNRRDPCEDSV